MKIAIFYQHPPEDRQLNASGGLRSKLADFDTDDGETTGE